MLLQVESSVRTAPPDHFISKMLSYVFWLVLAGVISRGGENGVRRCGYKQHNPILE